MRLLTEVQGDLVAICRAFHYSSLFLLFFFFFFVPAAPKSPKQTDNNPLFRDRHAADCQAVSSAFPSEIRRTPCDVQGLCIDRNVLLFCFYCPVIWHAGENISLIHQHLSHKTRNVIGRLSRLNFQAGQFGLLVSVQPVASEPLPHRMLTGTNCVVFARLSPPRKASAVVPSSLFKSEVASQS